MPIQAGRFLKRTSAIDARGQDAKIARLLLSRGAKYDSRDKHGRTPLMMACGEGHNEVVKLLLDCGARCDVGNPQGRTARDIAEERKHSAIVKLLEPQRSAFENLFG